MKARIKATGEIVEVWPTTDGYVEANESTSCRTFSLTALDFTNVDVIFSEPLTTSFDWESFRNETAAKVLASMVGSVPYANIDNAMACKYAITLTDELINQLKKPTQ